MMPELRLAQVREVEPSPLCANAHKRTPCRWRHRPGGPVKPLIPYIFNVIERQGVRERQKERQRRKDRWMDR